MPVYPQLIRLNEMNKEQLIQECLKLEKDLFMKESSSDNCYKLVIKKLKEDNEKLKKINKSSDLYIDLVEEYSRNVHNKYICMKKTMDIAEIDRRIEECYNENFSMNFIPFLKLLKSEKEKNKK